METTTTQTQGRFETPEARLMLSVDAPRAEWLELRRKGITATDLPAILGLNRYRTAVDVWMDKVQPADDDPSSSEAAFWGTKLEDPIAHAWAERHEVSVRRIGLVSHKDNSWQLASLDRLVYGCPDGKCALEVKTRSLYVGDEWQQGVPQDVLAQVQWQLLVTGLDHVHVAALIGGQRLIEHKVERNERRFAELASAAYIVWQAVQQNEMPNMPPEYWNIEYLEARHQTREGMIELTPEQIEVFNEWQMVSAREKDLEDRKAELRTRLIGFLGQAEMALIDGRPAYTYKSSKAERIDKKALATHYPDVATDSRIYYTTNSRTLRQSTTKEKDAK